MTGETIEGLYVNTETDDWFLLKTTEDIYELRLGGVKISAKNRIPSSYWTVKLPLKGKKIKQVSTDNFAVNLELSDGSCLIHSDTIIDSKGIVQLRVQYIKPEEVVRIGKFWLDIDTVVISIKE